MTRPSSDFFFESSSSSERVEASWSYAVFKLEKQIGACMANVHEVHTDKINLKKKNKIKPLGSLTSAQKFPEDSSCFFVILKHFCKISRFET